MITLQALRDQLADITKSYENPAMIIMNEQDISDLKGQVGFAQVIENPEAIFGIRLLIIPAYLYSEAFLKHEAALVLSKSMVDLLMESLK